MPNPQPQFLNIRELYRKEAPPDVLETIAHLSNDEVFTPPKLANQVLGLLPDHVWTDPDLKFLDPAVKTGVFLREAAKRLMVGLKEKIADEGARREHILKNMLFGIAITEMTALMSRRSLYCASDATREKNPKAPENCFSAVIMETPEGNIAFPRSKHDYGDNGKKTHCVKCGAKKGTLDGEDREDRENHAYAFIHQTIEEIFGEKNMKFDVIIGNPPYQIGNRGGRNGVSASPIYQLFVEKAKALEPKYLSMIIPARWYSGGRGLDKFRADMLEDDGMAVLVDIPDASEAFPGVEIKGGVCYFLREPNRRNGCEVRTLKKGNVISSMTRPLNDHDVLIRHNEAVSILKKVSSRSNEFVDEQVSSRKPFELNSDFPKINPEKFLKTQVPNSVLCYANGETGYVRYIDIPKNKEWIPHYKVIIPKAGDGSGSYPIQVTGFPILAGENTCCTETYLVAGLFEKQEEAVAFYNYMKTRFFRFMVSLRKLTQNMTKSCFSFVPKMDMSRTWTDADLYAHFGLTEDEIAFIESQIKEMP